MNRGKSAVHTIINGPEAISYTTDKAKQFASIFASNSVIDDEKNIRFPTFRVSLNTIRIIFSIISPEISSLIKRLDPKNASGLDEIPVIVKELLLKLYSYGFNGRGFPL